MARTNQHNIKLFQEFNFNLPLLLMHKTLRSPDGDLRTCSSNQCMFSPTGLVKVYTLYPLQVLYYPVTSNILQIFGTPTVVFLLCRHVVRRISTHLVLQMLCTSCMRAIQAETHIFNPDISAYIQLHLTLLMLKMKFIL